MWKDQLGSCLNLQKILPIAFVGFLCYLTGMCVVMTFTAPYSDCGRGYQTSTLASEPRAHEGAHDVLPWCFLAALQRVLGV